MTRSHATPIRSIEARAYRIPLPAPESDGTLEWDHVTLVVVHAAAGGVTGCGYGYSDQAVIPIIAQLLVPRLLGTDAMATNASWRVMKGAVRNLGVSGLCAQAISAVDIALWDLKARLLDVSLMQLLGAARTSVPGYASGGFTSLSHEALHDAARAWRDAGFSRVKIKVGRHPDDDPARVATVRDAVGAEVEVFVDANGAYTVAQALQMAQAFAPFRITWFEEPVSSDDITGLRAVREHTPPGLAVAAGEYGFTGDDFRRLLEPRCVDVLQADATRCGITGWLRAVNLCEAFHVPLSSHCAPALHASLCCAASPAVHVEVFEDHAHIEAQYFDGIPTLHDGNLCPHANQPGLGLRFREGDARCHLAC
ncbi:enolase C-terminal domain-like protein [Cupriavidus pinatubonensis]|uniref:enolase C-terminal domain-like protein n=1 Tax=Cupriavidus pinatubonensis TaxID=248026 RepID=UPI00112D4E2D|nr:enolase C-terminal domain-like protein [Cupriavidus pinatubonensis]TPQ38040.1 mandelate racemase [Cupriavidus pinatubonensis]